MYRKHYQIEPLKHFCFQEIEYRGNQKFTSSRKAIPW